MAFDYERDTREHYRDDDVAATYHDAFTRERGWRAARHRVIATRECSLVARFLRRVPHGDALDLPAGTGKLARVFKELEACVTACDISPNMLELARAHYAREGVERVVFSVCDAERIGATLGRRFDVAVCLRLLHRVPATVRRCILRELAACAAHSIVSTGVETPFHRARRRVRSRLLGGDDDPLCMTTAAQSEAELREEFEILDRSTVLPGLSQERIYLLRPRASR